MQGGRQRQARIFYATATRVALGVGVVEHKLEAVVVPTFPFFFSALVCRGTLGAVAVAMAVAVAVAMYGGRTIGMDRS